MFIVLLKSRPASIVRSTCLYYALLRGQREISLTPIGNENETHFIIVHVEPRDLTTGEANKYFGLGSRIYIKVNGLLIRAGTTRFVLSNVNVIRG